MEVSSESMFLPLKKNSVNKVRALLIIGSIFFGDAESGHKDFVNNPKLKEWIEFFKSAHKQQVTPASINKPVRKTYEMICVDVLHSEHPKLLKA